MKLIITTNLFPCLELDMNEYLLIRKHSIAIHILFVFLIIYK